MEEDEEFEILKKDLVDKSQQIRSLQAEIASQRQDEEDATVPNRKFTSPPGMNHGPSVNKFSQSLYLPPTSQPLMNASLPHPFSTGPSNDTLMKSYQQQLENSQRKLRIATEMCTEQELNYKNVMKDMELKFRRMLSQRDDFINLRESESNNQQQLINHLQVALEKSDTEKSSFETTVLDLQKDSDEKLIQIESLSKETDQYKRCFKNISVVLLPDIRKLSDNNVDDINELTVNSVSSMLEKVLMLHKNEQDLLNFQVKSLENKIKDCDKASGEKLDYEKKLVEIQHQEQTNNYTATIENKNVEIISLKKEVNRLENKLQNIHKKFKEEIIKYKANVGESKKLYEMKVQKVSEERDCFRQSLDKLQLEFESLSHINNKLNLETEAFKEGREKDVTNLQKIDECEKEKESLQTMIDELKAASQRNNAQFKSTIDTLEERVKEKESECITREKSERYLTEKLAQTAQQTEAKVKEIEKLEYGQKLDAIKKVIEKQKLVVSTANKDMEQKTEIIDSLEEKLIEYGNEISIHQQDILNLKEKNNQLKSTVAQRDGRVIDLQLKLTELKDHLKSSGQQGVKNSTALENAQQLNIVFQEKVSTYEKQKSSVQYSYDVMKQQYTTLQQELNQLLSIVDERNKEVQNVKRERKAIAKKLKEKNDTLIERNKENEQIVYDLKTSLNKNIKLNNACDELKRKVVNLSANVNTLGQEKQAMEDILAELEDVKDKEISNLLNRLHGSESDITKLKTVLKKYKMSDTNGVKLANFTQKAVTKQRAEVDNLKTKITWMKEALEVSEKERLELQDDINDKDMSIAKLQDHLHTQEEANQQLSVNLTMSKKEANDLQKALEQAALKYTDVYALVEKQEECLQRDRTKMQWFSDTRYKRFSPQDEMKEKERLHSTYKPHLKVSDSSTNHELKSLLEDVRHLLSSTLKKSNETERNITETKKVKEPVKSKKEKTSNESTSEKIIIIEPGVKRNTRRLNDYLIKHSVDEQSSSLLGLGMGSGPTNSTPRSTLNGQRRSPDHNQSSVYSNVDSTTDDETLPLQVTGDSMFDVYHNSTLKINNGNVKLHEKRKKTSHDFGMNTKGRDHMAKKESKKHRNAVQ